ncbi:hypothetical protein JCGZ_16221 [Jatropha curcas]|uniref:Uncharacterized protein n=1 Tax=Jatropha curcas TaxID=180498 RepID=A0A067KEJ0_JATCU|nr:hypothetical protein JCGZ_16221 [Jatropha curcas]
MESIQGQFRTYNNFIQDMREELQEIKAARSSNATRAHPRTVTSLPGPPVNSNEPS